MSVLERSHRFRCRSGDVTSWEPVTADSWQFGADRQAWPAGLKEELLSAQDRRCCYDPDGRRLQPEALQGGHFLPWSRFHAGGVANPERLTPDLRTRIGACLRDDRGVELAADARGASTITHPDR